MKRQQQPAEQQQQQQQQQQGKRPLGRKKFIRKEYRMMSDLERMKLQKAMNGLKERQIDNITIWNLHILVHQTYNSHIRMD
jgi:hypothetical protein